MADTDPDRPPSEDDSMLDKLRDSPVGTNDPMIIGDAGPTDIPPGTDGDVERLDDDAEAAEE